VLTLKVIIRLKLVRYFSLVIVHVMFDFHLVLALIMPEKQSSMLQGVTRPKKQQKVMNTGVKLDIIKCTERGKRVADISQPLDLTESIIWKMRKNVTKIKANIKSRTSSEG
jgi:hypothetical protein